MRRWFVFLLFPLFAACGGGSPMNPMAPGPMGSAATGPMSSFAGTWTGSMSEPGGTMMGSGIMGGMMSGMMSGQMTWLMTQNGDGVTGYMDMPGFHGSGRMTISGTASAQTMTFTMTIPAGGMPEPGCAANATGTAQVSGNTMTGSYSGGNTCTGSFSNGRIMLSRRP